MEIFLSYPSEERSVAERVQYALAALGYSVFFDRDDLEPGEEYDRAIGRAMDTADLFAFLITPDSVARGRYTLTELKLAEERWPHPSGRVLPVMLQPTPIGDVPAYLRAVSILEPSGDVVAEVAHEVDRLVGELSPGRRVLRSRGARVAAIAFAAVLMLGVAVWRPWSLRARAEAARAALYDRAVPLEDGVRQRARAVAATPEGYVIAAAAPAELVRYGADDTRLGEPLPLTGDPITLLTTPGRLVVATHQPDALVIYDVRDWSEVGTIPLDPARIDRAPGTTLSGEIRSIEVIRGILWIVTGGPDGTAAVLRQRLDGSWAEATSNMLVTPAAGDFDASGLRLRVVGEELWGVTTATSPSRIYRIMGTVRVDAIDGRDVPPVACARDIAESASGNMLVVSCENQLLELSLDSDPPALISARPTLPVERTPDGRTDALLVRDGPAVFVALNTVDGPDADTPAHARLARIDASGTSAMLDLREAVITALAVTPRAILAILLRADGSIDAVRLDRSG